MLAFKKELIRALIRTLAYCQIFWRELGNGLNDLMDIGFRHLHIYTISAAFTVGAYFDYEIWAGLWWLLTFYGLPDFWTFIVIAAIAVPMYVVISTLFGVFFTWIKKFVKGWFGKSIAKVQKHVDRECKELENARIKKPLK